MSHRILFSLAVLLVLAAAPAALAFEPGEEVVVVNTELGLRTSEQVFRDTLLGEVFTVRQVGEDSLTVLSGPLALNSGPISGELLMKDVVPLDDAVDHFEQLLAEEGESADYHEALGRIYDSLQDSIAALEHYDKAVELDPETAARYHARGQCYANLFAGEEALADYVQALQLDGSDPLLYMHRAEAYDMLGEDIRALADYERALELDDAELFVYISRAWFYANQGEYELASADFDEALELNGNDLDALYGAAWIRSSSPVDELRDGERAVELATHLIELTQDPVSWDYDVVAAAYAEAGDFERAIEFEEKAIALEEAPEFFQERIELYRRGEAFRDTPPPGYAEEYFEEDFPEDTDPAAGPSEGEDE